jgi:hypothetical protein
MVGWRSQIRASTLALRRPLVGCAGLPPLLIHGQQQAAMYCTVSALLLRVCTSIALSRLVAVVLCVSVPRTDRNHYMTAKSTPGGCASRPCRSRKPTAAIAQQASRGLTCGTLEPRRHGASDLVPHGIHFRAGAQQRWDCASILHQPWTPASSNPAESQTILLGTRHCGWALSLPLFS